MKLEWRLMAGNVKNEHMFRTICQQNMLIRRGHGSNFVKLTCTRYGQIANPCKFRAKFFRATREIFVSGKHNHCVAKQITGTEQATAKTIGELADIFSQKKNDGKIFRFLFSVRHVKNKKENSCVGKSKPKKGRQPQINEEGKWPLALHPNLPQTQKKNK